MNGRDYFLLALWIISIIVIGSIIGSLTKPEVINWYSGLKRSGLTPPNYVFSIAWTLLYAAIGVCGWIIWNKSLFSDLLLIKFLYVIQLALNWTWTPLFFHYHFTGISLLVLITMDILVSLIAILAYNRFKLVSLLMIVYLVWILFATFLNFYIWQYN